MTLLGVEPQPLPCKGKIHVIGLKAQNVLGFVEFGQVCLWIVLN